MALIPCKECGANMSTRALRCAQCGAPHMRYGLLSAIVAGLILAAGLAAFWVIQI